MGNAPYSILSKVDSLSAREREVVDLAVLGRTDEQIAQVLDISTSTVNSYWVRIRGKLGHISRTEIVASILRHESQLQFADLIAENERLRSSERKAHSDLAQTRRDLAVLRDASWHPLALDHAPDAILVCEISGRIVYANLRAQHLFAAKPQEMETLCAWDLSVPEDEELRKSLVQSFFEPDRAVRVVIGVERPFYGYRRDGTSFRGLLIAERFLAPNGLMAVLTVREYLSEVDVLIRQLRKPYEIR